jgi:hypothetical protein
LTVLAASRGFIMLDPLAAPDTLKDYRFLIKPLQRDERKRL